MRPPIFVRALTDDERQGLEKGLRAKDAFVLRRCQILLSSARGERAPRIAEHLGCDDQTVLDALQARAGAERDARHGGGRERLTVATPWRLAGQPLLIAPHGAGKGQWRWLLRCPAATFSLGAGRLNGICCQATLSSAFLWRFGHRAAWARVARLLDAWGTRAGLTYQVSELHL